MFDARFKPDLSFRINLKGRPLNFFGGREGGGGVILKTNSLQVNARRKITMQRLVPP